MRSPVARRRRAQELGLGLMAVVVTAGGYVLLLLADSAVLPPDLWVFMCAVLGLYLVAHLAVRRFAPRADATLLPIAAILNGIGFVAISRLDRELARVQAGWIAMGVVAFVLTLVFVPQVRVLERYKYTFLLLGIAALLIPLVPGIGQEINGARLWVRLGPLNFQPGEIAKVLLVIYFAAYLVEKRELLSQGSRRIGRVTLPDPKHLGPLLLAWGVSILVMVMQKDLGSSLLFFTVFAAMLYIATERAWYLLVALVLFVGGATVAYQLFGHVQDRVTAWIDPWSISQTKG
ncbi:MAG: FtsW/RodA/SpoVE family cell cycle protein, partial [Acidimicrobiia bacterium]